jgi:hypothetical protein
MTLAPVAVFTFRRPELTRQLFESLQANPEVRDTPVYVFSDGPRTTADAAAVAGTRELIRNLDLPRLTIVERETNCGLAANIIDGVSRLCREHGQAIVLEDDLVLSPTFLRYMNEALARYRDAERVYHVSGYQYPVDLKARADAVFLPFINSYGWATWDRAWKAFDPEASGHRALVADRALRRRFDLGGNYIFFDILQEYMAGRVDSWAIRWYLSVFMREGLALYPAKSLVQNLGFGEDATHTRHASRQFTAIANPFEVKAFPEPPVIDRHVLGRVSRFLGWEYSLPYRALSKAQRVIRRVIG